MLQVEDDLVASSLDIDNFIFLLSGTLPDNLSLLDCTHMLSLLAIVREASSTNVLASTTAMTLFGDNDTSM